MKLRKKRKASYDVEEIDITSLLDILVILLVFLLKSFNDSDLSVDLMNELSLPYSTTRGIAHNGVVVQMNKNKEIYLNNESLGNYGDDTVKNMLTQRLVKLHSKNLRDDATQENQLINFLFDKGLKYIEINDIMGMSSDVGFTKYKLIVQGDE